MPWLPIALFVVWYIYMDCSLIKYYNKHFIQMICLLYSTIAQTWLVTKYFNSLTEWRIYALLNWVIIGSDNGLSPVRRQAIIWTNAGILLIGPLGTNFSEILIGIQTFSLKKLHMKTSSAKWRQFCLGLNELIVMTSWHGNSFRSISPLWGDSTGHRWLLSQKTGLWWGEPSVTSGILPQKTSDSGLWCFIYR